MSPRVWNAIIFLYGQDLPRMFQWKKIVVWRNKRWNALYPYCISTSIMSFKYKCSKSYCSGTAVCFLAVWSTQPWSEGGGAATPSGHVSPYLRGAASGHRRVLPNACFLWTPCPAGVWCPEESKDQRRSHPVPAVLLATLEYAGSLHTATGLVPSAFWSNHIRLFSVSRRFRHFPEMGLLIARY